MQFMNGMLDGAIKLNVALLYSSLKENWRRDEKEASGMTQPRYRLLRHKF
jgi:hypothetical protein